MNYVAGSRDFLEALAERQDPDHPFYSERIAMATTPVDMLPVPGDDSAQVRYYLAEDGQSGYGLVKWENWTPWELIAVWSSVPGRGGELVDDAIHNGAAALDCFDGYLPEFYARHGFVETRREPNWTPGGPDVVYMARLDSAELYA